MNPPGPSLTFIYAAWLVALIATLGSLFLGEVMKLPPCSLCWYQRICMYPLVAILTVGIVLRDPNVSIYALPLVVVGLGLALYHNLLYYGVIAESLSPCTAGVPCTARQLELFGFISIPLMGAGGFVTLLGLLIAHRKTKGSAAS
jgi:disulfide bond formation protein DsbB